MAADEGLPTLTRCLLFACFLCLQFPGGSYGEANPKSSMTWQSYVDEQLIATKMVKYGAIIGHDGSIWAKNTGFNLTEEEGKQILARFGNTEELAKHGVVVAGVQYMFLSGNDKVIRAKKGTAGVHIFKTTQAMLIAVYEDPVVPEQVATVVEKLGEYFVGVGY